MRRKGRARPARGQVLSAGAALTLFLSGLLWAGPLDIPPEMQDAFRLLREGRYVDTVASAREAASHYPLHPLPPLIAGEAWWNLIFCETGHIRSSEIWNVADKKTSAMDADFKQSVGRARQLAQAMQKSADLEALGDFYYGIAEGLQVRLDTLRGNAADAGRTGKRMRAALLAAVDKDSGLLADAELGLGAYNYYADVLSPLYKFLRFFMGIPGGDREKGLRQLRNAADHAVLLGPEASYELARILGGREGRHADALQLFARLAEAFPTNTFYSLSAALEAEQLEDLSLAAQFAQAARASAAQMDPPCRLRLRPAAAAAAQRIENQRKKRMVQQGAQQGRRQSN